MKLSTSVILKELRFPKSSGKAKLTRSAIMISALGRTNDTIALKGLLDIVTFFKLEFKVKKTKRMLLNVLMPYSKSWIQS